MILSSMTKTTLPCPRCKKIGLEITDHIYCPSCKRRFKLPVLPRELIIDRKVAELSFDFGDGTEDTTDIVIQERVSMFGDEWR